MRTAACIFLLFAFGDTNATEDQVTNVAVCSKYTFHDEKISWREAKKNCREQEKGSLVSMETEKEWHFVTNLTKKREKTRWFIGLKVVPRSNSWCWLSKSIAYVNDGSNGTWRWGGGEPNNFKTEKCGEMLRKGKYNNIPCQTKNYFEDPGYICEKQFNCSTVSNNSKNGDIFTERATLPRSTPRPLVTKTTSTSSLTTQSTLNTQNKLLSEGTTFKNTVGESSPQNGSTGGLNLVLIVIVLLAIFILAIAVVFGISFLRRHQSHKNQDHLRDRVTCTYEVPPSSELQSIDPVLGQQIQSSAEVTVHLTLSQTESGPITHDPASDCKKQCEQDHLDETNRKSWSISEGCSDIQDKARENTVLLSGEKGIQQPLASCDKKEEVKDYVYAVVHKERKGGAASGASTLKKSSDRPQEGTGLPVNRRSCVDCNDRSSHPTDLGLHKNTEAAESKTPQAGGNSEYLYAAVDKTKKKKPPQKPLPYRGLVYADLIHSRESSAKFVKEQSQTVYAQIDHAKTASVMISQHNLEGKKKGELH